MACVLNIIKQRTGVRRVCSVALQPFIIWSQRLREDKREGDSYGRNLRCEAHS